MKKKAKVRNLDEFRNKKKAEKENKLKLEREFDENFAKNMKENKKRLFKKRLFKKFKMSFVILLLFLFGFMIYRWSLISRIAYERNNLENDLGKMRSKTKEINLQLEKMTNSNYVERLARERLQMDYPREDQIIYMQVQ